MEGLSLIRWSLKILKVFLRNTETPFPSNAGPRGSSLDSWGLKDLSWLGAALKRSHFVQLTCAQSQSGGGPRVKAEWSFPFFRGNEDDLPAPSGQRQAGLSGPQVRGAAAAGLNPKQKGRGGERPGALP